MCSKKFRDPVHNFIEVENGLIPVVDSAPFQRLRSIHQLAMTYMVYPGASHTRFEHSIGVMHIARRIFETITRPDNVRESPDVEELLPELREHAEILVTDRTTLMIAALLHDVGHLPFSHAAEDLLPQGWSHETMSDVIIRSDAMKSAVEAVKPYMRPDAISSAAVDPKHLAATGNGKASYTNWEGIIREIIQSDIVGADRMDYLLRDSYHVGVAYGAFDVHRLIDCVRVLAFADDREGANEESSPQLGITEGGLHVAEQLLMARYYMFTQVYFHKTRLSYDISLGEFLRKSLDAGQFPTDVDRFLAWSDERVTMAIREAARDGQHAGHEAAKRIVDRNHFRRVYNVTKEEDLQYARVIADRDDYEDLAKMGLAGKAIADALAKRYEDRLVRHRFHDAPKRVSMPVLQGTGKVVAAESISDVFQTTPSPRYNSVFVDDSVQSQAKKWLEKSVPRILEGKEPG